MVGKGRASRYQPKVWLTDRRSKTVREPDPGGTFCLYLWRTPGAPGTVYFAGDVEDATAVYNELVKDGYIVKVVHVGTDLEYEMHDGTLIPASQMAILNLIDQQRNPPRPT